MKRYLILCTLAAWASGRAENTAPQLQTVEAAQSRTASPVFVKAPVPTRHLSDQQLMELRRQLQQFNSQYHKG